MVFRRGAGVYWVPSPSFLSWKIFLPATSYPILKKKKRSRRRRQREEKKKKKEKEEEMKKRWRDRNEEKQNKKDNFFFWERERERGLSYLRRKNSLLHRLILLFGPAENGRSERVCWVGSPPTWRWPSTTFIVDHAPKLQFFLSYLISLFSFIYLPVGRFIYLFHLRIFASIYLTSKWLEER